MYRGEQEAIPLLFHFRTRCPGRMWRLVMDEVLKHKAVSCWERYGTSAEKNAMDALAVEFLDF